MGPPAIFLFRYLLNFFFHISKCGFLRRKLRFFTWDTLPSEIRLGSSDGLLRLGSASLFSMITTGFLRTVASPPDAVEIMPSLFHYLPPLLHYYK